MICPMHPNVWTLERYVSLDIVLMEMNNDRQYLGRTLS